MTCWSIRLIVQTFSLSLLTIMTVSGRESWVGKTELGQLIMHYLPTDMLMMFALDS